MTAASDHHTIAAMRTRHPIALGFLVHGITVHAITVQGITVLLTPSLLHASPSMSPRVPFQDALVAESVRATAPISEVTLYQGRAMIARTEASPAREGLFEMRFEKLPATIDPSTLQATVTSDRGGAKLLDVRYEEKVTQSDTSNNPELREAIAALEAAKRVGELNAMKMAAINDRYALLNAIRTKTATESAKDFGSKSLDPEALAKQIGFIDSAQAQLIGDRVALDTQVRSSTDAFNALQAKVDALGGQSKIERTAVVTVGQSIAQSASITLRYLVGNAGWKPRYAVRADVDAGKLVIEYDADINQASGEDWTDVKLTLSTAQPTQKAAPDEVSPFFVDVFVPAPPMVTGGLVGSAGVDADMAMDRAPMERGRRAMRKDAVPGSPGGNGGAYGSAEPENKMLAERFDDAYAVQSGTVAAYPLPRAISIASNAQRSRKQRIATVEAKPSFVHVARPLVESAVYLKAVAANASAYQFLAGPATVFLGGDSVGSANLPDLAPGAEMTFWLGTDRRIEAKRVIVTKDTDEKGVFDKSDETKWNYRIDIASTSPIPVTIELVDRMPVSRNQLIKIEMKDASQPLATDAQYIADEKPQGILKWIVAVAARGEAGKPATKSIGWTVVASKPKNTQTTGLPD